MFESVYGNENIVWQLRPHLFDTVSMVILFLSLVLLTISRLLQDGLMSGIVTNTFKNYSFKIPVNTGATTLLFINYFLVTIGIVYMIVREYKTLDTLSIYFFYGTVMILLLIPFINFLISRIFVGNIPVFRELAEVSKNLILLKSIIFSILLLLWVFNDQWDYYFKITLLSLLLLFYTVRVLLSVYKSLRHHVYWYYLILYFCTLEVLPYLFLGVTIGKIIELEMIV